LVIASISGIRGIYNYDLHPYDIARFTRNFVYIVNPRSILIARDTRVTGEIISKIVSSALLREGVDVVDYGCISTPALFRESRLKEIPAIMITASHNEQEWNGLKFVMNGRGVYQEELTKILEIRKYQVKEIDSGKLRRVERFSYNDELVAKDGEGTCQGVKVVLDLNGGAAIKHAPAILRRLGCKVLTLGDAPGLFNRRIDPTSDSLELLGKTVRKNTADIGLAFDCDGDRLVIVDNEGKKRSGDYMLTLALKQILERSAANIVVSVDTTQAVDDQVREIGGNVFRSKVGESNVLRTMIENDVILGGEGSSGGLIDASFNNCRDSMIAAINIIKLIKERGVKVYDQIKSYYQVRVVIDLPRSKAIKAIKRLQKEYPDADKLDGVKIRLSEKSWVLVRASETENIVRVSAESSSLKESEELAQSFLRRIKRLSA
jgi:phosphomannomutase